MRYCRQNLLKILNRQKQKMLANSLVAVIGLGALGTRTVELLSRSGVKNFILVDRDIIEMTNLQRQTLYIEKDLNLPKADCTKQHLLEIDITQDIKSIVDDLTEKNIYNIIPIKNSKLNNQKPADLILDCTDNQETKLLLNRFAVKNKIPLIYATVLQTKGYVFNILPNSKSSKSQPCLSCFLKNPTEFLGSCDIYGILNTACSLISTIQANEAVKILTKQQPETNLILADIWKNEIIKIKVKKNKNCKVCKL